MLTFNFLHNFNHSLIHIFGHIPRVTADKEYRVLIQQKVHKFFLVLGNVMLDIFDVAGIIDVVAGEGDRQFGQDGRRKVRFKLGSKKGN